MGIDTSNDYMALIYDFVVKKEENKTIYNTVRKDYNAFLISDSYEPYIINGKVFVVDEINSWMNDYVQNLSEEKKIALYNYYGYAALLKQLSKIAKIYGYKSYNKFIKEEDEHENYILQYIIENAIIKDILPKEYFDPY